MKKTQLLLVLAGALITGFFSCKKNVNETAAPVLTAEEQSRINAFGLSAEGAYKIDDGYIAEGDVFISKDMLARGPVYRQNLRVGNSEQYRVSNLVTGLPRTLSVRYTGSIASLSNALNIAIARFNALPVTYGLHFTRVGAGAAANITLSDVTGVPYIAIAGFPSGGNPFNSIRYNTTYAAWNLNTMATVIAHEMGHCIGFVHTDFMDKSFSCGGAPSPATGPYIHIPGTPTGPDPNSWMLTCITNGLNRPFNANDVIALDFLY